MYFQVHIQWRLRNVPVNTKQLPVCIFLFFYCVCYEVVQTGYLFSVFDRYSSVFLFVFFCCFFLNLHLCLFNSRKQDKCVKHHIRFKWIHCIFFRRNIEICLTAFMKLKNSFLKQFWPMWLNFYFIFFCTSRVWTLTNYVTKYRFPCRFKQKSLLFFLSSSHGRLCNVLWRNTHKLAQIQRGNTNFVHSAINADHCKKPVLL